ncbi:hypothetical protein GQ600_26053 [Phytophthora cactorum]|nr:hypothetical protein GQ600_26053 [Phytophthora cactorum]
MTFNSVDELRSTVVAGDFGPNTYRLSEVYKKIPRSRDRYITDKFSWEEAVQSEAPALVYRQACNDVAGCRGYTKIPKDPEHLYDILMTDNIPSYVREGVKQRWLEKVLVHRTSYLLSYLDITQKFEFLQTKVIFSSLNSGFKLTTEKRLCMWTTVVWFPTFRLVLQGLGVISSQTQHHGLLKWGNKKNSFNRMLDCTFADVLVQYPGDVVYLNYLVQHSVLLGYQPETAEIDK